MRELENHAAVRRLRVRLAVAWIAALTALALASLWPSAASARGVKSDDRVKTNTFEGTCTKYTGFVSWPERPLTFVPTENRMDLTFDGGRCTGTLNGRAVEDAPSSLVATLRGVQSCEAGRQTGVLRLVIAGRRFSTDSRYHRGLHLVGVALKGHAGGSGLLFAHVDTAPITRDDPAAQNPAIQLAGGLPVLGGLIVAQMPYEELFWRCMTTGVERAPGRVPLIQTTPSISSTDGGGRKPR